MMFEDFDQKGEGRSSPKRNLVISVGLMLRVPPSCRFADLEKIHLSLIVCKS